MPGFREGKAPPSLVIQRLGFASVLEEAIREALPEWYERALLDSGISPIGDPDIEMVSTPEAEGEPLSFKFEVGVRPPAEARRVQGPGGRPRRERGARRPRRQRGRADPRGLRPAGAGRARRRRGRLGADRLRGPARRQGLRGRQGRGLPAGARLRAADRGLRGAAGRRQAGRRSARSKVTFPEDYQAEHLAGEDAVFKVKVKEVREKILPELDDEFAADASEFDTLEELRDRHPRESRRGAGQARRGGLPDRRDRRRGRGRHGRRCRPSWSPPGRPNAGSGWNASWPSAGWTPTPSCRCRAKPARS